MRARRIPLCDISPSDEAAWSALAAGAAESNPFFEPECLLATARLPGGSDLELLVAEADGRFHACMPVREEPRWRRLPRPVTTTLSASGVDPTIPLGTPLVAPDRGVEGVGALLDGLKAARRSGGPGILRLDLVGADGSVAGFIRQAAAAARLPLAAYASWDRGVLYTDQGEWSPTEAMSVSRRRELERRRRRIGEALGGTVEVVDRAGEPKAVDEFLRMEASGWKRERGHAYANEPAEADWFRQVCARFAAAGRLSVVSLEVAGRSAAMQCCLHAGSGIFFFRVAHDEELSRYGPGVQVVVSAIERLQAQPGARMLDSCAAPSNEHIRRLFPHARPMATLLIGLGGALNRALVTTLPMAGRAKRRLKAARSDT